MFAHVIPLWFSNNLLVPGSFVLKSQDENLEMLKLAIKKLEGNVWHCSKLSISQSFKNTVDVPQFILMCRLWDAFVS